MKKRDYLKDTIDHFDITKDDTRGLVKQFSKMAFQARNIARASTTFEKMLEDKDCSVVLCLAGSLFSAGLKKVVHDMVQNNMVDVIVSTGAIIFDQDMFEAIGFKHYIGTPYVNDKELCELHIDRIYDTFIDEDELRIADETVTKIIERLNGTYSSREFLVEVGSYLEENISDIKNRNSVIYSCYKNNVPIFVPALSDSCAGFGLVMLKEKYPDKDFVIDSGKDFHELTKVKIAAGETGLLMIGGGVPKNFAQDSVVSADIITGQTKMHKYAIQITVADERDGALSGSTLKEANSWGKVDSSQEQMVFCEATIGFPILASYAYHTRKWEKRKKKNWNNIFNPEKEKVNN
ncbi:MAG: deoxyhypusine synthase [Planctomycetes bacterium]|nr:deoxyhypusine synthase [Planctomycetota bacterium]